MGTTKVTGQQVLDSTITDADIASANKDGVAATASMRTLGTGAQQACGGTDSRLSDTRVPVAASKSDQTTGTSTTVAVVPNVQQNHKSAVKCWVNFTVSGGVVTVQASYNVSSVSRTAAGDYTVNWSTSFADVNNAISITAKIDTAGSATDGITVAIRRVSSNPAVGSVRIATSAPSSGTLIDAAMAMVIAAGNQ